MKASPYIIILFLLFLAEANSAGQEPIQGEVTYITSQHVYVRFSSTNGLSEGDTLYMKGNQEELPALVILSHSSTSCVCEPLTDREFSLKEQVIGRQKNLIPDEPASAKEAAPGTNKENMPAEIIEDEEDAETTGTAESRKQDIFGRVTLASYSFLKNPESEGRQHMRYAFSLSARNIAGSGLTFENYMTFSHTLDQWDEIQEDIFNGLKIYRLSASYAFNESIKLTAGRRINPRLSSVGAIDGVQYEMKFGSLSSGIFAGSRPDYQDYSFNSGLFQYGAYLAHDFKGAAGIMQNTLAYIEQMNHGSTDRRFMYFQHSNTLVSNLWFFGSVEADLYENVEGEGQTVFNLYNTYANIRYRVIPSLTLSLSYSARNNLIYYVSYKDFLDRLLDQGILQGWRFRVNYRPIPYLYLGAHAAYRYRKEDPHPAKNANFYATYTRIPHIGASVTATLTWMQSSYLDGMIYGLGIGRDFLQGKLHADLKYNYVDQALRNNEIDVGQHVGEAGLSWNMYRKLSLSTYFEGIYNNSLWSNRIFISLNQRF